MFTITLHDPKLDTDEEIAERVELETVLLHEILPDDPAPDVAQTIAATRARPERHRRWMFKVRDDGGKLVGLGGTTIDPDDTDNPDILWCGATILPELRHRGVGSRLLAELVQIAEQEQRTRLVGVTTEGRPGGDEFATAIGAQPKQAQHVNHLPIAEVDRPMLERWVEESTTRAADYELISWDGPVSDDDLDRWIDLVLVMNTMPRDDLEMNDFTLTAEEVREGERVAEAAGIEAWTIVARHRESGEWAGFHDVGWSPTDAEVVWVDSTGVRPEHRGHALGKWLKAAMTLRVLEERPGVTSIRTGNADSNDAMLGINKEMGYRPLIGQTTWELPVADARRWLEGRGVLAPA